MASPPSPSRANTAILSPWADDIYDSFWEKDVVVLEKGEPVKLLDLGDGSSLMFVVHPTATDGSIIAVRPEYVQYWEYVTRELDRPGRDVTKGGLVLWGQPGIGKSSFLFVALLWALKATRPVIFCQSTTSFLLFDVTGVKLRTFASVDVEWLPEEIPSNAIILCDLETPPAEFTWQDCRGYVVHAITPSTRRCQWHDWAKERNAKVWVGSPWTRHEVAALQRGLAVFVANEKELPLSAPVDYSPYDLTTGPPVYYTPIQLFDLFGGSARQCFAKPPRMRRGGPLIDFGTDAEFSENLQTCAHALKRNSVNDELRGRLHRLFSTQPRPDVKQPEVRPVADYAVPTPFLRSVVLIHLLRHYAADRSAFASTFSASPQVAGILSEANVGG